MAADPERGVLRRDSGRDPRHAPGHDGGHRPGYDHQSEHEHAGHQHGHHEHAGHEHAHHSGVRGLVRSVFLPHSHDAADSVDDALAASAAGVRAVKVGLVGLGATALLQLLVVSVSASVALLADTIHNAADALTAVPLWFAFVMGRRPATRRYTYGYGRAEDLAGLFVVAMIAVSAVVAAWEAAHRLLDPRPVQHLPWVAAAGAVGFLGNELVATYRIRVGRRIGSAALVADGLHARTDGLTSLAVLLGAGGAAAGWALADPIVGLVITVAIVGVLAGAARDIYRRLMDAVDPELLDAAEHSLGGHPEVLAVRSVRMRWIGHRLHAEADLAIDPATTLADAHRLAHAAEHRLTRDVPKLASALVHAYPDS